MPVASSMEQGAGGKHGPITSMGPSDGDNSNGDDGGATSAGRAAGDGAVSRKPRRPEQPSRAMKR